MFAVLDWGQIGEVIWVSTLAGIGVTALFAVAVYGGSRSAECRRTGRGNGTVYAALGAVSLLVFLAVVIVGLTVALHKS